jgi:hypothetical protein
MTDEPHIEPLPTLGYYQDMEAGGLRLLARLVLLAGAISAACGSFSGAMSLLFWWPNRSSILAFTSPLPLLTTSMLCIVVLSGIAVAGGCVLLLTTGRGRGFTFWAEIVGIAADLFCSVSWILGDLATSRQNFPRYLLVSQVAGFALNVISSSIVPLLVLAVLTRRDTRRAITNTIASAGTLPFPEPSAQPSHTVETPPIRRRSR